EAALVAEIAGIPVLERVAGPQPRSRGQRDRRLADVRARRECLGVVGNVLRNERIEPELGDRHRSLPYQWTAPLCLPTVSGRLRGEPPLLRALHSPSTTFFSATQVRPGAFHTYPCEAGYRVGTSLSWRRWRGTPGLSSRAQRGIFPSAVRTGSDAG